MNRNRTGQRGAALVTGLILLVVITLLAVVGMNMANTELASATSDQLRLRAFNAAESGIEARMQSLRQDATTNSAPVVRATEGVENSPINSSTDEPVDTFTTVTQYRGEGTMLSRYSSGTFVGFHYSVESTGRSTRNAEAVHTAGAFIINGSGEGVETGAIDPDNAPVVPLPPGGLGSVAPGP